MNQIWFGTIAIVLLAIELKMGSGSGRLYDEQIQVEQVKKLLAMHREKMKPAMDKLTEEQQKDEKLQSMLKKLNECRAKHSNESRTKTPSILELNEKSKFSGALWQGDIFLTPAQVQLLFGDVSKQATGRFKRGAGIGNVLRQWPMDIKYSFDESINNELKGRIERALTFWNKKSCLNLTEDNSDGTISRIHFTSADNGCFSRIGMVRVDFTQPINLGPGCESDGIIHHQIAHTLGLWHEHSRLDRDSHFWIYARNANPNYVDQFDRQTGNTLIDWDIGYDLGSVTHFDASAFSKDEGVSMMAKKGAEFSNSFGPQHFPSFRDVLEINRLYCSLSFYQDGTSVNFLTCATHTQCGNGNGFQNPKNCSACICKPEYTGANCETLKGKEIQATDNWNDLNGEVDADFCSEKHWLIRADSGKKIAIQIKDIGTNCADACTRGFLEIHTEEIRKEWPFPGPGLRLCCPSDVCALEEETVTAANGHAMLNLRTFNGTQSFHIRFRQY
uniref:Metalloendopeptidase n=1 Tax=Globodera rostochiensis TaxID=31243 RepID=A0A914I604_GLORO